MQANMFCSTAIVKTAMADGGFVLSSATPIGEYADRITDHLIHWAAVDPDRRFLAQRGKDGEWEGATYGEVYERARSVGQYLINAGCGPEKPVASISDNGIHAACFALGAIYAGVPLAQISTSYVKIPDAYEKLHACLSLLKPAFVYVDDISASEVVRRALGTQGEIICDRQNGSDLCLQATYGTQPVNVDAVNRSLAPGSVAKYLFTSGSTGSPKAVVNTHRMLCANQKQLQLIYPFVKEEPPVIVDWLPWSHTFGGNEVFFLVMAQGGTLYIDKGKPLGKSIEETIRNLKSVSPTIYFNVPTGFDQLVSRMEHDAELKRAFFAKLRMVFYAGAGMPQRTWTRLEEMSVESTGRPMAVVTAWGATETAPLATGVYFESHRSDNIGLPVPGCEIRFAPIGGRLELRVRGPNVMPGYLGKPELNATIFDEDGFYKTGDAASLADNENPGSGIIFGGRIAEDFKLQTGTWVSVGRLSGLLAGALMPLVTDLVVIGSGREYLSILVFLSLEAGRACAGEANATLGELAEHPRVLEAIQVAINEHNKTYSGASMRIEKFRVAADRPSAANLEITEKGSINQAAVLKSRAATIEKMYEMPGAQGR